MKLRASNRHASYGAFVVHRVSGVLLTLFLPVHFWALSLVLKGQVHFNEFLSWTEHPLVKTTEFVLVVLLSAHLAGGLRLLAIEFLPWNPPHKTLLTTATGLVVVVALTFALNLI